MRYCINLRQRQGYTRCPCEPSKPMRSGRDGKSRARYLRPSLSRGHCWSSRTAGDANTQRSDVCYSDKGNAKDRQHTEQQISLSRAQQTQTRHGYWYFGKTFSGIDNNWHLAVQPMPIAQHHHASCTNGVYPFHYFPSASFLGHLFLLLKSLLPSDGSLFWRNSSYIHSNHIQLIHRILH